VVVGVELTPTPVPMSADVEAELVIQSRINEAVTRNESVIRAMARGEVFTAVLASVTNAITLEVADDEMDKDMAKRLFCNIRDGLNQSWTNPFVTTYSVSVCLDRNVLLEIEVEADDESEAEDEVQTNLSFDDLVIHGTIRYDNGNGEQSDFEYEISDYDYDVSEHLTFRVSEAD
jgi:hypothetical protein